jgi:hypothetical protein
MTESQLDTILTHLYNDNGFHSLSTIEGVLRSLFGQGTYNTVALLEQMLKDNIIIKEHVREHTTLADITIAPYDLYSISLDGKRLFEEGGYTNRKLTLEEEKAREIKKERLEIEQLESVIQTNRNVREINSFQKRALWATIILSATSIIISIIGLLRDERAIIYLPKNVTGLDTSIINTSSQSLYEPTLNK